jgi:stage V sporulation protein G
MEITEVRISPSKGGKIRAFASIVLDDCFIVNDLRVMEGREGQLFVTMPARKSRNGQMRDIAHPLRSETRRSIEERVLAEFRGAVERLVVPDRSKEGKPERQTAMDRLAAKLFSDEFWTAEVSARGEAGRDEEEEEEEAR